MNSQNSSNETIAVNVGQRTKVRNLVAFWFLGLFNNYSYVVMLSAAHDILGSKWNNHNSTAHDDGSQKSNSTNKMLCNDAGTAVILLADVLPSLLIKVAASFLPAFTQFRMLLVVVLSAASFIITSYSVSYSMSIFGVVCTAISCGLGEVTLVGYAAFYDKNVISTWSSGTGGAGLFGALSYMLLTQVGVSPRTTLLILLFVPVCMAINFWLVLVHPPNFRCCNLSRTSSELVLLNSSRCDGDDCLPDRSLLEKRRAEDLSLAQKYHIIKKIFIPLMLPLATVYMAEYFINQVLMELLYYPKIWLTVAQQYRWYQADYQLGVLLSRSSVNLIFIRRTWIFAFLQVLNVILLSSELLSRFIPSIWLMLTIILYEGLLGGAAYVNTFYRISKEMPEEQKEFALSICTISDGIGITLSAVIGIPMHTLLCKLPYKKF